jgi:hypothetical protein
MEAWLERHPDVRLVVIDTLTRVRQRGQGRGSNYEIDYDSVAPFAELGQACGIAIALVHHTRKPKEGEDEDPFDTISGTLGLLGAADTMWVLKRPRSSADARLHCRGRDLEEDLDLVLTWDRARRLWSVCQGDDLPPEQRKAHDALSAAGQPLSPMELAPRLGKAPDATRQLLSRMKAAGLVRATAGKYVPVSPASPNDVT